MLKFLVRLRSLGRPFALLAARLKPTDLLDIAGVALLVTGAAMVYAPAAFFVAGVALLAMSWQATRPPAPAPEDDDA